MSWSSKPTTATGQFLSHFELCEASVHLLPLSLMRWPWHSPSEAHGHPVRQPQPAVHVHGQVQNENGGGGFLLQN